MAPRRLHLLAFFLLFSSPPARSQFGIAQNRKPLVDPDGRVQKLLMEMQIDAATGEAASPNNQLVDSLLQMANTDPNNQILSEQDAVDMASILEQASRDAETLQMVLKLKAEKQETIEELLETTDAQVLLKSMKGVVNELKMIEVLFTDKERAVREMQAGGMIDKDKLPMYEANPELLEHETRTSMYFMFSALAVAAGFL